MSTTRPLLPAIVVNASGVIDVEPHKARQRGPRGRPPFALRLDRLLNRVTVLALIALGLLLFGFGHRGGVPPVGEQALAPPASGPYVLADVERGDLLVKVSATGTVEPVRLIEVSTQLSGLIRAVHVENNAAVVRGQLLAELDDAAQRHELARAEAQVSVTRAKVAEAEALSLAAEQELGRKSTLARRNLATQKDLEAATADAAQRKAAASAARAEIASAQAALAIAVASLARTRIVAPIDGVVLRRNVEPGQTIAASLQAPVLFRLAQSLERMQIRVDVDEADVMQVRSGQPARFSVQAMRDRQLEARVEKVFLGPEIVQGVVTYKAILSFDNVGLELKPGMTATAEIIVERVRDGVLVPNAALRFSPPDAEPAGAVSTGIGVIDNMVRAAGANAAPAAIGQRARGSGNGRVFVAQAGGIRSILVETGASDGERTVVIDGALSIGQRVVVDILDKRR